MITSNYKGSTFDAGQQLKLKRHVDHPQQTTLGSGLIAILIGVALIAAPAVINGLADTFGLGGAVQTVSRPRL